MKINNRRQNEKNEIHIDSEEISKIKKIPTSQTHEISHDETASTYTARKEG